MTTLIIYRGETQVDKVVLTGKPMKIGRGKDNDIVLEDPGKGVSRVHAELRPEGDRYRLVDLQSQNGTWVSGQRVPSVLLAPGVVAAMGPFRVAVDASSPLTQAFAIPKPETFPDTGTEFSRPLPARIDEPEPMPAGSSDALLDDLGPAVGAHPIAPAPAVPPTAPAAAKAPAAAVPAAPARRPAAPADADARSRTALMVVAALVVMLVCAVGGYALLKRRAKPPVWDATVAAALADSGRCQEALDQQINRALAAEPNNPEALRLKAKCTAPPPEPTTTTVPAVTVTATNKDKLDAAEVALQSNACQAALDAAKEVLAADANDERAQGLAKRATDCLNPPSQPQRANAALDPVVRVAPAQGGLDPQPGETGKQYKARVDGMGKRYEDAVALLQAQKYQQALTELNAIAGQVPPGYRDLAQRRGEARTAISEEGNRAYAAAQQAEQRQDWKTALAQYQRAQALDPARDVSADVARVNDARTKAGHQLCQTADAAFSLGHASDAIDRYTKALELLSSSDECYARAKERLKALGR